MGDVGVSISEIIEVRGCRLNDDELLALIIIACEQLAKTPSGLFTPDYVFVHMLGDLEIQVVSADKVNVQYTPPEILEGNTNPDPGAVHVFCLGEVVRFAGASESSNADIFSLLNIMTVAHVPTRPSIVRLAQMAKNKLNIQNPKALLAEMYVLVMGDEADDIEDLDISCGEYVLDALGEIGELKETNWTLQHEIGSPALSSTKIVEEIDEEKTQRIEEVSIESADKELLSVSYTVEEDPFEADIDQADTNNLATLSGRDPFNAEFIEDSQSGSLASPVQQSQVEESIVRLDERKKEKQRKLLLDASDMLMGTTVIEDFDEEPYVNQPKTDEQVVPNKMENIEKKKPLSWPEPGNRHEYDYDDDIVEYKESDSLDEANQKPLAYTSEINHFISKKKNEPTTIFESYDHHLTPFSSTIRVPPTVEEILESPASLSPISEANENLDKLSESAAVTETTSSTLSTPEKVSPSTIDMSPPRFIPTNDTNKVVSQVIPEDEELPTTAVAEKRGGVGVSSQRRKPDERVTEKEHADDEQDTPQGHVDAVVLERPKPDFVGNAEPSSAAAIGEVLRRESDVSTTKFEAAEPTKPPKPIKSDERDEPVQHFSRRNSLGPGRISGRKHSLRNANKRQKGRAEPEFVMNENAPSICLKAPAMRKKKMSLHRVEQTGVKVELLNGKNIEVSCRSDAIASEVADVVMRHINFNENSFFGLTTLRDGEHFFLEENQRLEKFAPSGWKNAYHHGVAIRRPYNLYLRFRYYPATTNFIKTDVVLHELYLQLRHDVLDDRLQPPNDALYELAALALQAEYSDRPSNPALLDYFQLEHYLPEASSRAIDLNDERRLIKVLCELHSHYGGLNSREAEAQFIMRCQRLSDYGGHFHRVYKMKPSSNLGNTPLGDPQTGFPQWIGILPRGILQYEEHRGVRHEVAEHLWQDTQTLQFDKKRFVIVSELHHPPQSVFYTDHYTKSAYFVRFAASQHRFMIKMRQWTQTLQAESSMRNANIPDVGADTLTKKRSSTQQEQQKSSTTKMPKRGSRSGTDTASEVDLEKASEMFPKISASSKRSSTQLDSGSQRPSDASDRVVDDESKTETIGDNESTDQQLNRRSRESTTPEEELSEGSEGSRFAVTLTKDPKIGLGLTLVDGNLNGIKGVYVKSVTDDGPGKKNGVNVGDRLMSVNGVSLVGKDRHATVDLVRQSGSVVRLSIFRLDAISTALTITKKQRDENGVQRFDATARNNAAPGTTRSRTPPAPKKVVAGVKKRQRAVSDFGAVGDTLPELNSEDLVDHIRNDARIKSPMTLDKGTVNGGGADLKLPASSMYRFDTTTDDEDEDAMHRSNDYSISNAMSTSYSRQDRIHQQQNHIVITSSKWSNSNGRPSTALSSLTDASSPVGMMDNSGMPTNSDWADDLDDSYDERCSDVIAVRLDRNEAGSLGVQIASSGGAVFVKQITAEPAISNPNIQVGDRIITVNGERIESLTHQQVVELLKGAGESVVLGIQRSLDYSTELTSSSDATTNEKTITVVLEKSPTGSLGLSLAKKTGYDGIFIRMIGSGSAADIDGTLRVGDKIWQVNGQSVNNYTPGAIVNLLKSADNPVEIIVKRTITKQG